MNRTYSEIGSSFWLEADNNIISDKKFNLFNGAFDSALTFSGRTAISLALKDILLNHKNMRTAYVPSYCCMSMIQPFLDLGFDVEYYNVVFENGHFAYHIDYNHECGVFLIMNYFGLHNPDTYEAIKQMSNSDCIIIEDVTHSLLCEEAFSPYSDYLVGSLRKWFPVASGGIAAKTSGRLSVKPDRNSGREVETKLQGMKEKSDFIRGISGDKDSFLSKMAEFEKNLPTVDAMLKIDTMSEKILNGLNIDNIISKRRTNAQTLLSHLSRYNGELLDLPGFDVQLSAPLFFPVFLENSKRDSLRKYLTEQGIYCPVHWPKPAGADDGIEQTELSLICDQRYSENDMKVIVNAIDQWYLGVSKA